MYFYFKEKPGNFVIDDGHMSLWGQVVPQKHHIFTKWHFFYQKHQVFTKRHIYFIRSIIFYKPAVSCTFTLLLPVCRMEESSTCLKYLYFDKIGTIYNHCKVTCSTSKYLYVVSLAVSTLHQCRVIENKNTKYPM